MATTTALLENRLRFDVDFLHARNGNSTTLIDGGKGIDLIVGQTTEIQIAAPPYVIRNRLIGSDVAGFGDWPFLRVEERLAAEPEDQGNYVVTALLQIQAPSGRRGLTNNSWVITPMLGFGKGWGDFDIQGMTSVSLPTTDANTIGHSLQANVALQYRVLSLLWPEVEGSWTYFADGRRGGLNQVFLTLGVVLGRVTITDSARVTVGGGYEFAVAPAYRARPLTPAFDRAWVFSSRINFQ